MAIDAQCTKRLCKKLFQASWKLRSQTLLKINEFLLGYVILILFLENKYLVDI